MFVIYSEFIANNESKIGITQKVSMSTTIIAVRHAKPLSEGYADELLRPLHKDGISAQKEITHLLIDKGYIASTILSSPILRAKQTADILSQTFKVDVEITESLGYAFNADDLIDYISKKKNQTLILVGHAPSLGEFVNTLVGRRVLPAGLSKSGTAIVLFEDDIKPGNGSFIEYFQP